MMSAVTQQMVKESTTPEIRQQLSDIAAILAAIPDRNNKLLLFSAIKESSFLHEDTLHLLKLITAKETQHIEHVRSCLKKIPQYPQNLTQTRPHDFSKDCLYFFATTVKFDCEVKTEAMEGLFQAEVSRHYELEPHHQQYEEICGEECSEMDILEMAVDRLSRSAQAGGGSIDMKNMRLPQYTPVFTLGDNLTKQALFSKFVNKYKDIVEQEYNNMFRTAAHAQL